MKERTRGLGVYVAAAVPARAADAGAVVAAVLAGTSAAGPAAGGLLAAALTIPHLIGPLAGRLLDARRRPGPVLAVAFTWHALFVVVAAAVLPASIPGAAAALAAAGCAGPLVTGGLSSRLSGLLAPHGDPRAVSRRSRMLAWQGDPGANDHPSPTPSPSPSPGADDSVQRRGQALDALTYGVAGTVGPAAIAAAASILAPRGALAATGGLLVTAAIPVLWLPAGSRKQVRSPSRSVLRLLIVFAPLRRTTVATIGSATALAAAPVIATGLAAQRGAAPSTAAILMSLYGGGGLIAALLLIARPLTGRPERLVRLGVAVASAALLSPLLTLAFPNAGALVGGLAFAVVGAASSALFAATLAARTEYSPPGAAARVFATVAGVKVAGSAIGVAAAGLIAPLGAGVLILCAAAFCALTLVVVRVDAAASAVASRRHAIGCEDSPEAYGRAMSALREKP